MKIKQLILLVLSSILFFYSCTSTSEQPDGEFAKGVFIVNEGNFSESNGSVGFYNEQTNTYTTDIFEDANGVKSGGILQSLYFGNEHAYIIDQVGSAIHVVDPETFESITTINVGLSTPRYMVELNGKAYITNWGDFDESYDLPNSYIAVVDLSSFEVVNSIATGNGAEGIAVFGEKIYVANSYGSTLEIIDPKSDSSIGQIDVADGPQSLVEDKNGKFWLLSNSFITGSALSQLDLASELVLNSFSIGASAKSLNINGAGDELYYLSAPFGSEAAVHRLPISLTEDSKEPLITAPNLYGLGVHPKSGMIYLGNHNAFQGNGTIVRYQGSEEVDSFSAGVAPNGFVFR